MPANNQKQEDYTWALNMLTEILWSSGQDPPKVWVTDRELAVNNALRAVLQSTKMILCTWHIDNDVEVQVRKYGQLVDEDAVRDFMCRWRKLRLTTDRELYAQRCAEFGGTLNLRMVSYFTKEWAPYDQHFAACYTNNEPHFGTVVDSRIEKMHDTMKCHNPAGKHIGQSHHISYFKQYV